MKHLSFLAMILLCAGVFASPASAEKRWTKMAGNPTVESECSVFDYLQMMVNAGVIPERAAKKLLDKYYSGEKTRGLMTLSDKNYISVSFGKCDVMFDVKPAWKNGSEFETDEYTVEHAGMIWTLEKPDACSNWVLNPPVPVEVPPVVETPPEQVTPPVEEPPVTPGACVHPADGPPCPPNRGHDPKPLPPLKPVPPPCDGDCNPPQPPPCDGDCNPPVPEPDTGKGNNGVGNGLDPQPPGNPPVNDGPGTSPGSPGNKGGAPSDDKDNNGKGGGVGGGRDNGNNGKGKH